MCMKFTQRLKTSFENCKADQLQIWRTCTSRHALQTVKRDFIYAPYFPFYLHAANLRNLKLPFSKKICFIYILSIIKIYLDSLQIRVCTIHITCLACCSTMHCFLIWHEKGSSKNKWASPISEVHMSKYINYNCYLYFNPY